MPKINQLLTKLNPDQIQAATFTKGPLLILAGAGAGKTRTLIHRAAHLIKNHQIPTNKILLVTFTNKASQQMQEQLKKLTGTRLPFSGTFHSFCAKLLRTEGSFINIPPNFVIFDNNDQLSAIKQVFKKLDLDPKEHSPKTTLYSISNAKNELITANSLAKLARENKQKTIALVYKEYQKLLDQCHALDFDDLLFKSVQLLKENHTIREKYQNKFIHVLVDEYQDTNQAQYQLTKILSDKHKNLCVVGDASQAIYGWRGANYKNLTSLKKDFPNLTTIKLNQNYRSTQTILDAAHGIIKHNKSHPILKLWTNTTKGTPITIHEANNEKDEAYFILNTINQARTKNPSLKLSDFSVLYRTNAQSRVLEEIFMRSNIPYTLIGGTEFYQRKEVKDILAYLQLVANSKNKVSYQRAEKIGKRRLSKFLNWLSTTNTNNPPLKLLNQILKVTDYMNLYNEMVDEDLARIENIKELKSVASTFTNITDFLENVALVQNKTLPNGQNLNQTKDSVTFMTLHSSKGLEFNTVFLIGMEEGLFPHSRSMFKKSQLEEERRLYYVGITRAKQQLLLTYAKNRLYFGTASPKVVSRFIAELPENTLKKSTTSTPSKKFNSKLIDEFLDDELDIDKFLEN